MNPFAPPATSGGLSYLAYLGICIRLGALWLAAGAIAIFAASISVGRRAGEIAQ